ncbi:MAG: zinc-binding dehydrogenase [Verrucomicrobia bacterium]|nr:zinc-binding dehydrogenase [Verrucomicrobiota bacterium]
MAKRLVFSEPFKVSHETFNLPPPGPGDVLARTAVSGISHGTEMTAFLGVSPFVSRKMSSHRIFTAKETGDPDFYPYRQAGHDAVGVVERIGAGVTDYRVGDRVWHPTPHQTAFVFPANSPAALRLGRNIRDDEAILISHAAAALSAVHDAEIKLGDVAAVIGGGALGQLAAQMALLAGARKVFLVEPVIERRAFAVKRNAITVIDPAAATPSVAIRKHNQNRPPDAVLECSGTVAGLRSAIQMAGMGGTVVAAGFYTGNAEALRLGEEFIHNRVTIKASVSDGDAPPRQLHLWNRRRLLEETACLLEASRLKLEGFVSAHFPFLEAQRAYDLIRNEPSRHIKLALIY